MLTTTTGMPSRALRQLRCRRDLRIIFVLVLCIGVMLFLSNIYQLRMMQQQCVCKEDKLTTKEKPQPIVWVHALNLQTGYLKHVTNVFSRIGYKRGSSDDSWDVLWVHAYPFVDKLLKTQLFNLKGHQKVNHFPGGGYITRKGSLAMSDLSFIPRSFKIPEKKAALLDYIKTHPEQKWVQKSNNHRGVHIKTAEELNFTNPNTFVQEYIGNPYLIDGRMFDIGLYVTLTSIEPLRVYVHAAEWLLRFCPHEYYPFDPEDIRKYVITNDYLPVWKVDSLSTSYNDLKTSAKVSLLTYMKRQGKDTEKLQNDLMSAIQQVYLTMEKHLIDETNPYVSKRNFFEMVRFDFILDEDLHVYLLEVNMSPNLSSAHFPRNKLMYEQVVFSMLSLVGVARQETASYTQRITDEMNMQVSDRDLSIYADQCSTKLCEDDCRLQICKVCFPCLNASDLDTVKLAYLEHINRKTWSRVFPGPFTSQEMATRWRRDNSSEFATLNNKNRLMTMWFLGKCLQDASWCS